MAEERRLDGMVRAVTITAIILFAFWALFDGITLSRSTQFAELDGDASRLYARLLGLALAMDAGVAFIAIRVLATRRAVASLVVAMGAYAVVQAALFTQEIPALFARIRQIEAPLEVSQSEMAEFVESMTPLLLAATLVPTLLRIGSSVLSFVLLFRATRRRETVPLSSTPETAPGEAGTPSRRT